MNKKRQTYNDINLVAGWCEYKFPHCKPLMLFAVVYLDHCAKIAMMGADYQSTLTREGPVVDEAYKAMACLGYKIEWEGLDSIDFTLFIAERTRSNHQRAKAISYFSKIMP